MSLSSQQLDLHPFAYRSDSPLPIPCTPFHLEPNQPHNLIGSLANGSLPGQKDEYPRAPPPPHPTSGDPSILFAAPPHPNRPAPGTTFRHPLEASAALQALRASERETRHARALQGLPTTRDRNPRRSHSPTLPHPYLPPDRSTKSPYRPYTLNGVATRTVGEAGNQKKKLALDGAEEENRTDEVLLVTHPESQPRCRVWHLAPQWTDHQRFTQALARGGLRDGGAGMEMETDMDGWEGWVDWDPST